MTPHSWSPVIGGARRMGSLVTFRPAETEEKGPMAYEAVAGSLDFRDVAERLRRLDESLMAAPGAPLEALVVAAHEQIPGASAVSITTLRRGRFVTDAASTPRALAADQIQYDLQSGPCLQATVLEDLYNPRTCSTTNGGPSSVPRSRPAWASTAACPTSSRVTSTARVSTSTVTRPGCSIRTLSSRASSSLPTPST